MKTHYDDARRTLCVMLHDPYDTVEGLQELSQHDQQFLATTCAATVMLHFIGWMAGFDEGKAREGLAALELDKHLRSICQSGRRG